MVALKNKPNNTTEHEQEGLKYLGVCTVLLLSSFSQLFQACVCSGVEKKVQQWPHDKEGTSPSHSQTVLGCTGGKRCAAPKVELSSQCQHSLPALVGAQSGSKTKRVTSHQLVLSLERLPGRLSCVEAQYENLEPCFCRAAGGSSQPSCGATPAAEGDCSPQPSCKNKTLLFPQQTPCPKTLPFPVPSVAAHIT